MHMVVWTLELMAAQLRPWSSFCRRQAWSAVWMMGLVSAATLCNALGTLPGARHSADKLGPQQSAKTDGDINCSHSLMQLLTPCLEVKALGPSIALGQALMFCLSLMH